MRCSSASSRPSTSNGGRAFSAPSWRVTMYRWTDTYADEGHGLALSESLRWHGSVETHGRAFHLRGKQSVGGAAAVSHLGVVAEEPLRRRGRRDVVHDAREHRPELHQEAVAGERHVLRQCRVACEDVPLVRAHAAGPALLGEQLVELRGARERAPEASEAPIPGRRSHPQAPGTATATAGAIEPPARQRSVVERTVRAPVTRVRGRGPAAPRTSAASAPPRHSGPWRTFHRRRAQPL